MSSLLKYSWARRQGKLPKHGRLGWAWHDTKPILLPKREFIDSVNTCPPCLVNRQGKGGKQQQFLSKYIARWEHNHCDSFKKWTIKMLWCLFFYKMSISHAKIGYLKQDLCKRGDEYFLMSPRKKVQWNSENSLSKV